MKKKKQKLFTEDDVCKRLKVTRQTLYTDMIRAGVKWEHTVMGAKWRPRKAMTNADIEKIAEARAARGIRS